MKAKVVPRGAGGGAVGKFQAVPGQVLFKFGQAVHLERQMREVGLHLHGPPPGKR